MVCSVIHLLRESLTTAPGETTPNRYFGIMFDVNVQEDHDLIRIVRNRSGDHQDAASTLLNRLGAFVVAMISRHSALQPADVDEVAQAVWQKAFDTCGKEDFESAAEFRAWLKQVAKTKAIDEFRRQQRRSRRHSVLADQQGAQSNDQPTEIEPDENISALRTCLELLQKQKPAFANVVQKIMLGKSGEEISSELGLPTNTVYTRFSRGKKLLRECVEGSRS